MNALLNGSMMPCPVCGALLSSQLVAAVKNPARDESCPRSPKIGEAK